MSIERPSIDGIAVTFTATLSPLFTLKRTGWKERLWTFDKPLDGKEEQTAMLIHVPPADAPADACVYWRATMPGTNIYSDKAGFGSGKDIDEAQTLAEAWIATRCGATPPRDDAADQCPECGQTMTGETFPPTCLACIGVQGGA